MCRSRHLLEALDLGRLPFDAVQRQLAEKGLKVATGTIVDAIVSAPSSIKNAGEARDPEMHQTEKLATSPSCRNTTQFGVDS